MTEAQRDWLKQNPKFRPVKLPRQVVSLTYWADEGWLFPSGRYAADDGSTLFWGLPKEAIRVGRECVMT